MKKKELKRAVLLGMAMSMAVWTTGMAQGIKFEDFVGTTEKGGTITVTEDTTVYSPYAGTSSYLEPKERVGDYDIELSRDSTLTLHNLNTYNVNITGEDGGYGGNVVINVDTPYSQGGSYSGGLIVGSAENDSTYIRANNLTINNIRSQLSYIKKFLIYFDGMESICRVTDEQIGEYFTLIIDEGNKAETVNRQIFDVYKFFQYLNVKGYIKKQVFDPDYYSLKVHPYHHDRSVQEDECMER